MYPIQKFNDQYTEKVISFLRCCLHEPGRNLYLDQKHKSYLDVQHCFDSFWIMLDGEEIIGTAALKRMDECRCELKSLYLYERFQGRGLGRMLLKTVIEEAARSGYREMYLDTLSTSARALILYEKAGFVRTERYNENYDADIFMVLKIGQ